jgi:hypothetical protein
MSDAKGGPLNGPAGTPDRAREAGGHRGSGDAARARGGDDGRARSSGGPSDSGPKNRLPRNGDHPGHPSFAGELMHDILEPHASLRYIARLFKALAVLLLILLIAELVIGFIQQGQQALPVLMVEATRLVVFAGVLWGLGDMALMLIESNHDLRATRLMVWQLSALMKMRMDHEGIQVEPVRPPMERGGESGIRED